MVITGQTIISAAAVIAAVGGLFAIYNKAYDMWNHQKEQDKSIKTIQDDLKQVNEEQAILTYGILACLKGLSEQGCNGPVTEAIKKIETHMNKASHGLK